MDIWSIIFIAAKKQREYLEQEGVTVVKVRESESYRVDEFEYRKLNIRNFKITVLKTDKEIMEQFSKLHGSEDK